MKALLLVGVLASVTHAGDLPKKDRERAKKSTVHRAPPKVGVKPAALVNIYNEHTREWLAVDPAAVPASEDHFLRDHFTNEWMKMDRKLIPVVVAAAVHFKSGLVAVVSAFRHPKFNLYLRKKGHQVARDSEHTHGNAIDFYVPNVDTKVLQQWAKGQKLGGVGLYLESKFVHMDTGPIRFWTGD